MSVLKVNFNLSPPSVILFENNSSAFSSVSLPVRRLICDFHSGHDFFVIVSDDLDVFVTKERTTLKFSLSLFRELLVQDISRLGLILRSQVLIDEYQHYSHRLSDGSLML